MVPPGSAPHLAIVLTGGRSSRMGADKATLTLGGARLVDHVMASCRHAGLALRIAGATPPDLAPLALADPAGLAGPAAGLVAAMRAFPATDVVLLATDQPFVKPDTLRRLLAVPGPAVVPLHERPQSMCAIYRAGCAAELERLVAEQPEPSLQSLLDRVEATRVPPDEWRSWGEDGRSWLSIDTPELLAAAAASWPEPPLATIAP